MFLNNGSGSFAASQPYLLGDYPSVLDFTPPGPSGFVLFSNNDVDSQSVVVIGSADGKLNAPHLISTGDSGTTAIAAGDINGDGLGDTVVLDGLAGTATVFTGVSGGTFHSPVIYSLVTSADANPNPQSAALVHLRTGGTPDLVVANRGRDGSGGVLALLNQGNGTFGSPASFPAGANPAALTIADFNGDGHPDVAVADTGGQFDSTTAGAISVLFGNGQGAFDAPASYATGQSFGAIASADFNGDGKPDLIAGAFDAFGQNASYTILLNIGTGTFTAHPSVPISNGLAQIVTGDFNGDGKMDAALIGGSIQILLGKGDGSFTAGPKLTTEFGANTAAVVDLNGDGILDLVISHCCGATDDTYLLGKGDGSFQSEVHFPAGPSPIGLAVADWNGDGIPDLAIADKSGTAAPGAIQTGSFIALNNWFGPVIVSAAGFQAVTIAPESIAAAFGRRLATTAEGDQIAPPPTTLAGTTVQISDFSGTSVMAPLFYASSAQVNFEVPAGLVSGPALVTITAKDGFVNQSNVLIQPAAPGIFILNGAELAAADVIQVSGGQQNFINVYQVSNGAIVAKPIDLGGPSDQNILVLFGTGFRSADRSTVHVTFNGIPGVVQFSGSQGAFLGLDQANVVIPQSAGVHGDVMVAFSAAGLAANTVHLTFQ